MASSHTITSVDDLAALYRQPTEAVLAKESSVFDDGCRRFIERSPFVLVATSDADGALDVSPRGGPAGFVKVLDEHRLVIPDLNGNNRLDSLRNIVEQGHAGLLFVIPGMGEALRVNGAAQVTTDPGVLDLFVDELRRPTTAIEVTIAQAFIHCAKAFRRGNVWSPNEWLPAEDRPSPGEIFVAHTGADDVTGAEVDASLEAAYVADLAADLPEGLGQA